VRHIHGVTIRCNWQTMAAAFVRGPWNRHDAVEIVGLVSFIVGLGGILFGNIPLALVGFGAFALAETDIAIQWAHVTVPTGLILIFAGVGVYLIH
jgi:hypothetical protein